MATVTEDSYKNYEDVNEEEYYEEEGELGEEEEVEAPKIQLEGQALKEALMKQVDYYFSKENLMSDRYLLSQMNSDLYVPISIIEGFKMIKSLTEDHNLIVAAMKECKSITLNEDQTMVKPNLKAQRNTIILREIPSDTDPQIVKNIFGDKWGNLEVKADIGDCWFVNLENDETTLQALDYVRSQTYNDQPIKARIKTESTLRVFQLAAASTTVSTAAYYNNLNRMYAGYGGPTGTGAVSPGTQPNYGRPPTSNSFTYQGYENHDPNFSQRYDGNRRGGFRAGGRRKDYGGGGRGRGYRGRDGNRKRRGSSGSQTSARSSSPQQVPNLGTAHFPPLVPSSPVKTAKQGGYAQEFVKFSKQEIIDVIQSIKQVSKPDDLDETKGSVVILLEPVYELEVIKPFPKKKTALEVVVKAAANPVPSSSTKPPPPEKVKTEQPKPITSVGK